MNQLKVVDDFENLLASRFDRNRIIAQATDGYGRD